MHFVTFTAFPLTCRWHIMFCMQDLASSSFHHASTVAPLLVSCVLNAAIPTIEFDKMQSFQPASQLPGLPSHPASQAAVCPAEHAGSSNSDGGRCYGWLIHQAKQNKAKQKEAQIVDKKIRIAQQCQKTFGYLKACAVLKQSMVPASPSLHWSLAQNHPFKLVQKDSTASVWMLPSLEMARVYCD